MGQKPLILVVDDQPNMFWLFEQSNLAANNKLQKAEDGRQALECIQKEQVDLVLLDLRLPDLSGLEVLERMQRQGSNVPVIIMTAFATVENAVEAMKLGAYDYVVKPFAMADLEILVQDALKWRRRKDEPKPGGIFVAESQEMRRVVEMVNLVAATDASVLLLGESGTGKEVIADLIHQTSQRRTKPLVPINCAALPEQLLEAELFGYEAGAYTGANKTKPGKFELADQGTLFLDEIGELPLGLQAKLLRVLEDKQVERLGGVKRKSVDVRVVAASNRDLELEVSEGRFRRDLFYRLAVVPINIPPLRQRKQDIAPLLNAYNLQFAAKYNHEPLHFSEEAFEYLQEYSWPGNVRELKNLIERLSILYSGTVIELQMLPASLRDELGLSPELHSVPASAKLNRQKELLEREVILEALKSCNGNRTRAAEKLGISRRWLQQKIKTYGLT